MNLARIVVDGLEALETGHDETGVASMIMSNVGKLITTIRPLFDNRHRNATDHPRNGQHKIR
jgi:hypothetical protein